MQSSIQDRMFLKGFLGRKQFLGGGSITQHSDRKVGWGAKPGCLYQSGGTVLCFQLRSSFFTESTSCQRGRVGWRRERIGSHFFLPDNLFGNDGGGLRILLALYVATAHMLLHIFACKHSKSESRDPNGATKKIELSANLSKNDPKWPKNDPHFFRNIF